MKVTLIIGVSAYAVIKTDAISMDIRLESGRSASASLRSTATEWRMKAARLLRNAEIAEQAAEALQS